MSDISITRHMSIFNPIDFHEIPIHIIGCGATGSRIFMSLVELGCTNITCYDFDNVEAHNLANQAFIYEHIGVPKVDALQHLYTLKTGAESPDTMHFINACVGKLNPFKLDGIVFLLTDTMASRKEIYEECITADVQCLIETRMASTHGNVFCVEPTQFPTWFSTLGDDEHMEVSPCGTSISVGPTANIIANLAVWQMIAFLTDPLGKTPRSDIYLKPLIVITEDLAHVTRSEKTA